MFFFKEKIFDNRNNISEIQEELSSDSSFDQLTTHSNQNSGLFGGFFKDWFSTDKDCLSTESNESKSKRKKTLNKSLETSMSCQNLSLKVHYDPPIKGNRKSQALKSNSMLFLRSNLIQDQFLIEPILYKTFILMMDDNIKCQQYFISMFTLFQNTKDLKFFNDKQKIESQINDKIDQVHILDIIQKTVDFEQENEDFNRIVILTHEYFINSLTFLLYLIQQYLKAITVSIQKNEYILKLIKFFIQLRKKDIFKNYIIYILLKTFYTFIQSNDLVTYTNEKQFFDERYNINKPEKDDQTPRILKQELKFRNKKIESIDKYCQNPKNNKIMTQILYIKSEIVAEIMYQIEKNLLLETTIQDLLKCKSNNSEQNQKLQEISERFNSVVFYFQYLVLQESNIEIRARYILKYLEISRICYKRHNYNTLQQIYSVLSAHPIKNLHSTWQTVKEISKNEDYLKELHQYDNLFKNKYYKLKDEINKIFINNNKEVYIVGMNVLSSIIAQYENKEMIVSQVDYISFRFLQNLSNILQQFQQNQTGLYESECAECKFENAQYQFFNNGIKKELQKLNFNNFTDLQIQLLSMSEKIN